MSDDDLTIGPESIRLVSEPKPVKFVYKGVKLKKVNDPDVLDTRKQHEDFRARREAGEVIDSSFRGQEILEYVLKRCVGLTINQIHFSTIESEVIVIFTGNDDLHLAIMVNWYDWKTFGDGYDAYYGVYRPGDGDIKSHFVACDADVLIRKIGEYLDQCLEVDAGK